jgi:opacity protein-like surface antigen
MHSIKLALLGTATLAALTMSARADDLSDLKAQIEALNGRISQLEATPTVPAGYKLLSVSETDAIIVPGYLNDKEFGDKATNIGITPTADVPPSTNFQWTGFVRAGVVYRDRSASTTTVTTTPALPPLLPTIVPVTVATSEESIDVVSRAGLKFVGSSDTAVGEVGIRIALLATVESLGGSNRTHDESVATDGYWGWWKITPELTLSGGVDGTLANSSNLFDNRCTCAYIKTGGAFGHEDPTQIRLAYESGPISFAIAVEDEANAGNQSALGFAGEMKYTGDSLGFDLNAGYWDSKSAATNASDAAWTVNVGANMSLGDMANLGLGVGMGENKHLAGNADSYAKAGLYLDVALGDHVNAEFGATYTDYKGNSSDYTVAGGLYYAPVEQLTIGMEGSYSRSKNVVTDMGSGVAPGSTYVTSVSSRETRADVIAVWRF